MDATRPRRTRSFARQRWYANWRSRRFARRLGFPPTAAAHNMTASPLRRAG
jgi:hypothetical protein